MTTSDRYSIKANDVVSFGVLEQIMWERDLAESQLAEIGKGLGEKMDDVVKVRHGRWIDTGSGQECSVCGEIQYGYDSGRHYCPNCGAKMVNEDE